MPNGSYDPKLSEAGFMDLVCAIKEFLKTPESRLALDDMPVAQRDAAIQLGEAARAYVDAVEGGAAVLTQEEVAKTITEALAGPGATFH